MEIKLGVGKSNMECPDCGKMTVDYYGRVALTTHYSPLTEECANCPYKKQVVPVND
jgi:hypothetical protein